jgi:hypothetical protein
MKDLTKTMEISMREMEEQEAAAAEAEAEASGTAATGQTTGTTAGPSDPTTTPTSAAKAKEAEAAAEAAKAKQEEGGPPAYGSVPPPYVETPAESSRPAQPAQPAQSSSPAPGSGTPHPGRGIPIRAAIMDKSEEDARLEAEGVTDAEKELREKQKKKGGLTKEQREELAAYEMERKKIRDERVQTLSKKLIDRISIWTETDKGADVTQAFKAKTQLEIEHLKMESFGLEIMHAVGSTYLQKATSFIKSQKFLGIQGFFSRVKDKGTLVKETWNTMSAAIDAQLTMEEMAKLEEKGGEEWTDEKKAEYEKRVTGKILAAAWRGSKFEIQSVLREVCDHVLNDKKVKLEKRVERAHALVMLGELLQKVCPPYSRHSLVRNTELTTYRQSATLKKKATLWPSSSSWPKPQRRKMQSTRSMTNTTRRNIGRRRKHESFQTPYYNSSHILFSISPLYSTFYMMISNSIDGKTGLKRWLLANSRACSSLRRAMIRNEKR